MTDSSETPHPADTTAYPDPDEALHVYAAERLARTLDRCARDLEDAAAQIWQLAVQARNPEYAVQPGLSYHGIPSRALSIALHLLTNMNFSGAFEYAALADKANADKAP